jgi:hypothetical protein
MEYYQATQLIGETLLYKKHIISPDAVSSATWTVSPSTALGTITTDSSSSSVLFSSSVAGTFVLVASLTMASGQVLKFKYTISVTTT